MPRLTAIILFACSLIAVGFAAPVKYDQRQDGNLNVATKVENVWVILARPSKSSSGITSSLGAAALQSYLGMLNQAQSSVDLDDGDETDDDDGDDDANDQPPTTFNEDDITEDAEGIKPDESSLTLTVKPEKSQEEIVVVQKVDEKPSEESGSRSGKSLWSQIEDIVDNDDRNKGSSLKNKELLTWSQDVDPVAPAAAAAAAVGEEYGAVNTDQDVNRLNYHNEVGLTSDDHRYTLLGSGIEDCGPDRQRNSYGICQPAVE